MTVLSALIVPTALRYTGTSARVTGSDENRHWAFGAEAVRPPLLRRRAAEDIVKCSDDPDQDDCDCSVRRLLPRAVAKSCLENSPCIGGFHWLR